MITEKVSYEVLDQTTDKLILLIAFPIECGLFDGHFPDYPLLPGVVQLHLAVRLFEKLQNTQFQFLGCKAIKFFNPIFPGSQLRLECQFDRDTSQLNFEYRNDEKNFSKGSLAVSV